MTHSGRIPPGGLVPGTAIALAAGRDLSAALRGSGPSPRDTIFDYSDNELRAVRKGAYQAHFITIGAYDLGAPHTVYWPSLLFDLAADPGEHIHIAAHPDMVAELAKATDAHRRMVVAVKPLSGERLPAPKT
jgi:arylsulfatase A-like enzyme